MKILNTILISLLCLQLNACAKNNGQSTKNPENMKPTDTAKIKITIGSNVFIASLGNSATATAFKARLPLNLNMADLNGNEKHVDLPNNLPTGSIKPGTIETGDLMLYGANTVVLFYKTFPSSYSYSPIGRIDNPSELMKSLGDGSVIVKFELND